MKSNRDELIVRLLRSGGFPPTRTNMKDTVLLVACADAAAEDRHRILLAKMNTILRHVNDGYLPAGESS